MKPSRPTCVRCNTLPSVYNVIAPLCLGSAIMPLCPSCFQIGIDEKEIVWLGDTPYGICTECEEASA